MVENHENKLRKMWVEWEIWIHQTTKGRVVFCSDMGCSFVRLCEENELNFPEFFIRQIFWWIPEGDIFQTLNILMFLELLNKKKKLWRLPFPISFLIQDSSSFPQLLRPKSQFTSKTRDNCKTLKRSLNFSHFTNMLNNFRVDVRNEAVKKKSQNVIEWMTSNEGR